MALRNLSRLRKSQAHYLHRGLRVVAMPRSSCCCRAMAHDCSAIRLRMRGIPQTRVHYGCERMFVVLRREGWQDNRKWIHRIYALIESFNSRLRQECLNEHWFLSLADARSKIGT